MKSEETKKGVVVSPGRVIRERRQQAGLKSIELARKANVNPRTLNAIEMGRIKSPSVSHLDAIASALGISIATFFSEQSPGSGRVFLQGDQKGEQTLNFHKAGFQVVCYTPLTHQLFVGKVIVQRGVRVEHNHLPTAGYIFAQPLIGKLTVEFDGKEHLIKEGSYTFFDGGFPHSFLNPLNKEISFLLITAPSFLAKRPEAHS